VHEPFFFFFFFSTSDNLLPPVFIFWVPQDSEKITFLQIRKQNYLTDDILYEKSLIAEPRK